MLVLLDGKLMWPPPKPEVRAAAPQPPKAAPAPAHHAPVKKEPSPWPARLGMIGLAAILALVGWKAPPAVLQHLTVFLLAVVVGWHVIWNVTPALHTADRATSVRMKQSASRCLRPWNDPMGLPNCWRSLV